MIKQSQLTELVQLLVKKTLNEIGTSGLSTSMSSGSDTLGTSVPTASPDVGVSPATQAKLDREKRIAARDKVKVDQKMLKKVENDVKSQKATYDLTRRYTKPNLKKQVDAEKKALRTL